MEGTDRRKPPPRYNKNVPGELPPPTCRIWGRGGRMPLMSAAVCWVKTQACLRGWGGDEGRLRETEAVGGEAAAQQPPAGGA